MTPPGRQDGDDFSSYNCTMWHIGQGSWLIITMRIISCVAMMPPRVIVVGESSWHMGRTQFPKHHNHHIRDQSQWWSYNRSSKLCGTVRTPSSRPRPSRWPLCSRHNVEIRSYWSRDTFCTATCCWSKNCIQR